MIIEDSIRNCNEENQPESGLFEDSDFAINEETFTENLIPKWMPKDIECIRVPELGKRIQRDPIFVPENYNGLQEVYQRSLPNCGWVPGMSKLTQYPTLFQFSL